MGLIGALNCKKNNYNLGTVTCEIFLNEFKTPYLIKKGWRMLRTTFEALTEQDIVELVQTGVFTPVTGSKQFTNNTPEPTTEEYSGGTISVVRNGNPAYQFDIDGGINKHKALSNLNSFGSYDIMIADKSGNLAFALTADGLYVQGFEAGMVNTATYVPKAGDTSANSPFSFQLTNEDQFNRRIEVMTAENSPTDWNSLQAIVGVTVSVVGTPAVGATTITIDINAQGNSIFGIEALDLENIRIVNGTTNAVVTPTNMAATATPGRYILTVPALTAATYTIQLYDATVPVAVAHIEDTLELYAGISNGIVVATVVFAIFSPVFNSIFG